jgi:hypothetical protein
MLLHEIMAFLVGVTDWFVSTVPSLYLDVLALYASDPGVGMWLLSALILVFFVFPLSFLLALVWISVVGGVVILPFSIAISFGGYVIKVLKSGTALAWFLAVVVIVLYLLLNFAAFGMIFGGAVALAFFLKLLDDLKK